MLVSDASLQRRSSFWALGHRFGLAAALLLASPVAAQFQSKPDRTPPPYVEVANPRPPYVVTTSHKGRFNGRTVTYNATVGETFIPGVDNKDAAAAMVSISYLRTNGGPGAARPVLFMFNGGPGASSTPLQGAMAPRVRDGESDRFVDNPDSTLDVADLVFVDPVGAGLSRPLPGKPVEQYWTTKSDAQSFRYFIQKWLKQNHREDSPRYIVGESYGTARAGHIAELGADLNLDGIVLISSVGTQSGTDLPYVMSFPTFASAAAYHGRADTKGLSPQEYFQDNIRFARGTYLSALVQGDELPTAEREAIATQMSTRLGIDRGFILEHNLRLGNYDFMLNLLKAEGDRTGQLDSRAKGPIAVFSKRSPPYDDPSMSLGKVDNTPQKPASNEVVTSFLRNELHYATDDGYIGLNLKLLFAFKHDVDWSYRPTDSIAALMKKQPKLRLMQAGGIYDITTPFYGALYNLAHSDLPRDRVVVEPFVAGHEVYSGKNRKTFNQAIRGFVQSSAPTSTKL